MRSELLPTTKRMNLRAKKKEKKGGITPLSFLNLSVLCFEWDFKATWCLKSPCCVGGKRLLFFGSNTVIQQCTPVQNKIKMLISILVFRGWSNRGRFFLQSEFSLSSCFQRVAICGVPLIHLRNLRDLLENKTKNTCSNVIHSFFLFISSQNPAKGPWQ